MAIKTSLNSSQIKTISYIGIFSAFVAAAFFSWSFLYTNFYLVMTQSSEIMNIPKTVPLEKLDLKKFDEVVKKIEYKSTIKEDSISNLNNPFK
jgi:hypothetical protein